ncbi:hypothetical protein SLS59_004710 [Nothophoma quercina]|uniref:AAA+ ATPase lid domain-containing protein n=1 Tax=Nothophoma quercina TaxID=749835 RepID=A0ABR3RF30_9PLEO
MAESAIEKLVMNNNNKDMIKAIAKTYTEKTQMFSADFIYGKGEGQVILLHGPPGTGKTLTAVFLRALDYFQGILFLTTNRVGQFDQAFMSRIHLSLGYEELSDSSRETIWENLFEKLLEDHRSEGEAGIKYDYYAKEYVTHNKELLALKWNGREIRNGKTALPSLTGSANSVF